MKSSKMFTFSVESSFSLFESDSMIRIARVVRELKSRYIISSGYFFRSKRDSLLSKGTTRRFHSKLIPS